MKVAAKFDHYNFNVLNLEKSIDFYEKALGLTEASRISAPDGSFIIVFLTDNQSDFKLEITWLKDWDKPYEMGDNEVHLCVRVSNDYEETKKYHSDMGWVCYENNEMNLYFIADPDNHWIEILQEKNS